MTFSILVCIKAVTEYSPGEEPMLGERGIEDQGLPRCMNLYDAHALEAALGIRDRYDDVHVAALSVGTDPVRGIIRRAMAMGADRGIHLAMDDDAPLPPESVAAAIADYTRPRSYDLILTGAMSEDVMQGLTGPMIAAALDRPCAVAAVEIERSTEDGGLTVVCELEAGMATVVCLSVPALVTVQTGRRTPRYPSLSNTLRSRHQAIERIEPQARCFPRVAQPVGVAFPRRASTCRVMEGSPVQKADALLALFNDNGWLK